MLVVTVYALDKTGEDQTVGTIRSDGTSVRAEPADSQSLQTIISEPVVVAGKRFNAKDSPDEWLSLLCMQYKSAYLRASKPKNDSSGTSAVKSAPKVVTKTRGAPCKRGETAARTGCIPAGPRSALSTQNTDAQSGHTLPSPDTQPTGPPIYENGQTLFNVLSRLQQQGGKDFASATRELLNAQKDNVLVEAAMYIPERMDRGSRSRMIQSLLDWTTVGGELQTDTSGGKKSKVPLPSKAKIILESTTDKNLVDKAAKKFFGPDSSAGDFASAIGAPDDAVVDLIGGNYEFTVRVKHKNFNATRVFQKTMGGKTAIHNSDFFLTKGTPKGTGIGSEIFYHQVVNSAALGVSYLEVFAAGGKDQSMNGYYTWPRLGYDGPNPYKGRSQARVYLGSMKDVPPEVMNVDTMMEVMKTQVGRDWWKENGSSLDNLMFDLTEGSPSRQVLDAYMAAKGKGNIAKSVRKIMAADPADGEPRGEEIDLSPEEETILDQVWDQIGKTNTQSLPSNVTKDWITIGGEPCPPGKEHCGGTHVYIDGSGKVTAGPSGLMGKPVNNLNGDKNGKNDKKPGKPKPNEGPQSGLEGKPQPKIGDEDATATAAAGWEQPDGRDEENSGQMEGETGESGTETDGGVGEDQTEPVSAVAPERIPATRDEVNKRLSRYEKLFRAKGQHQLADWMGMLRNHVEKVGTDEALKSLGEEVAGEGERVQFAGWENISQFTEAYLDRNGIVSLEFGTDPEEKIIGNMPEPWGMENREDRDDDIIPTEPGIANKLDEAKNLPGLESSEDLSVLMGGKRGKRVPNFTPSVLQRLDDVYGKDGWIVKSYGEDASGGFGIYFPQRVTALQQDAKNAMWQSGEELAKYGFTHLRDEQTGSVIGLQHSGGDEYLFGSKIYDDMIGGDARQWGDMAERASKSELALELAGNGKKFMAQPAFPVVGVSDADRAAGKTHEGTGEGRVHIATRNGKAEIVPHSTWVKGDWLPVVFEDEGTRAMAQAAVDAINHLPESERQGQIYAPDVVRGVNGYNVVEANPAEKTGTSGYLKDNPLIIDSYVSHLTGREPAHVRFIRNLLSRGKDASGQRIGRNTVRPNIRSGTIGGTGGPKPISPYDTGAAPGGDPTESTNSFNPEKLSQSLTSAGVEPLPPSQPGEQVWEGWEQPPELLSKHSRQVLNAAKRGGFFIPPDKLSRVTQSPNVGGDEHDVHEDADNNKFFKFTKNGHFGNSSDIYEYTKRHEMANQLWPELGYKFHGVTQDASGHAQTVISMNRIEGTHPEQQEVEDWFTSNGWQPLEAVEGEETDGFTYSWLDPETGTTINDTHTGNMMKTQGGMVPIDVDIVPGKPKKKRKKPVKGFPSGPKNALN